MARRFWTYSEALALRSSLRQSSRVFDELHRGEILTPEQLSQALEVVSQNKRCRLPKAEIQKRLKLYKGNA